MQLQSRAAPTSGNQKKSGCLDVVFSGAYPIASGAETGGSGNYLSNPSPTSIRKDTYFSEEKYVKLRRCLKQQPHQVRYVVHLNKHWQLTLGSAEVRDSCNRHRTTPYWILQMPRGIISKKNIKYNIFFILIQFSCDPKL